ncbi:MAG TPA: transglutaminase-like domain-containing protein, partial [Fimbriimonas sp.]|nr:transglutaminase-like domain-containing protein [Fimbriimonas sp.]
WTSSYPADEPQRTNGPNDIAISEMDPKNRHEYKTDIHCETDSPVLPLPAEPISFDSLASVTIRQDGGGTIRDFRQALVTVHSLESTGTPRDAEKALPTVLTPDLDPAGVSQPVVAFTSQAIQGAKTDYDKAMAIERAIAGQCKYSLAATAVPSDREAVDFFLNDSKVGYCDMFATSMVECARVAGIPARYVVGYLPDEQNRDDHGHTLVTDRDYHAWAELLFKGVGWVVFDATTGAQVSTDKGAAANQTGLAGVLPGILDILIAAVAVLMAVVYLKPRFQKRRVRKTGRADVERLYISFARTLQSVSGQGRQLSKTPDEYLLLVTPSLNGSAAEAQSINSALVRALYAEEEPTEETVADLKAQVHNFKRTAKKAS